MGGGLALVLACLRPDAIGATVPFYGLIPWEHAQPDYSQLTAPVLGHYAGDDGFFSPELVDELQARLDLAGQGRRPRGLSRTATTPSSTTHGPRCTTPRRRPRAWVQTVGFLHSNLDD